MRWTTSSVRSGEIMQDNCLAWCRDVSRWTKAAETPNRLERVRELTKDKTDKWIRIWALVRLVGQRQADVAREFGYANGSSVLCVVASAV